MIKDDFIVQSMFSHVLRTSIPILSVLPALSKKFVAGNKRSFTGHIWMAKKNKKKKHKK